MMVVGNAEHSFPSAEDDEHDGNVCVVCVLLLYVIICVDSGDDLTVFIGDSVMPFTVKLLLSGRLESVGNSSLFKLLLSLRTGALCRSFLALPSASADEHKNGLFDGCISE